MKHPGRAGVLAAAAVTGAALGLLDSRSELTRVASLGHNDFRAGLWAPPAPRPSLKPSDFEMHEVYGPGLRLRSAVAAKLAGSLGLHDRPIFEGLSDAAAYYQARFDVRPLLAADVRARG